jgi:hypothetical protein
MTITVWHSRDENGPLFFANGLAARDLGELRERLIFSGIDPQTAVEHFDMATHQRLDVAQPAPGHIPLGDLVRPSSGTKPPKPQDDLADRLRAEKIQSALDQAAADGRIELIPPAPSRPQASAPKLKTTAVASPPPASAETAMPARRFEEVADDERRRTAMAIGFALAKGDQLVKNGILTLNELDLIRQRGDQELIERQDDAAYREFPNSGAFDVLEQRARRLPPNMTQDEFNRESDKAIRKLTVATHSDAWLGGVIDGKAALGAIKGVAAVPSEIEGDDEERMMQISLDTFAPSPNSKFKPDAPPPPLVTPTSRRSSSERPAPNCA